MSSAIEPSEDSKLSMETLSSEALEVETLWITTPSSQTVFRNTGCSSTPKPRFMFRISMSFIKSFKSVELVFSAALGARVGRGGLGKVSGFKTFELIEIRWSELLFIILGLNFGELSELPSVEASMSMSSYIDVSGLLYRVDELPIKFVL